MTRERVLITGGAAGIGAACARRCEADGLEAVVIDRVGDGLIADLSDPTATAQALDKALPAVRSPGSSITWGWWFRQVPGSRRSKNSNLPGP